MPMNTLQVYVISVITMNLTMAKETQQLQMQIADLSLLNVGVCVCDAESSADPGCTVSANEASPQEIKQAFHSSDGVGL